MDALSTISTALLAVYDVVGIILIVWVSVWAIRITLRDRSRGGR
jgi:molybdenum cofactor biosynthesis enzyme